jgi:probable F420-dependent oxidoreductase
MPLHPFRFGVEVKSIYSAARWTRFGRQLEDWGYSTLTVSDHFDIEPGPIAVSGALAAGTRKLRLGATVLANDFRHPAVLAKELATLDVISEGRLEIGLGAGWQRSDFERAGFPFESPGVRIARLAEAVQVLKQYFSPGPADFTGRYYHLAGLDNHPRPVQRPHPPILLGGGGRRVLSLAAREADIVSIGFDLGSGAFDDAAIATSTEEATERKVSWVRAAAGERFASLELSIQIVAVAVTNRRRQTTEEVARALGVDAVALATHPQFLIGTREEIVQQLLDRRRRFGFSYIVIRAESAGDFAPVVARLAST